MILRTMLLLALLVMAPAAKAHSPLVATMPADGAVLAAAPVKATSVIFIAASMAIIEISDMPAAVFSARRSGICRARITVSSAIEVSNPLMMARVIIAITGQGIPVI